MKFDPNEIINPKRRLTRQAEEAGLEPDSPDPASVAAPKPTMSQSEFFKKPATPESPAKTKKLIELMRKQQAEQY